MKTIFTFLLFIIVAINVNASIIYVNHAATGANNGTSWANAYTDLEYAMLFAMSGDEIWVAKGTYYTSSTNDRSSSFALGDGVKLYGNFAGTETDINQRVGLIPDAAGTNRINETILNGDIGVANDSTDNAYHIMYIVGNTLPVIIDGVKITGGNASVDPGKGIGSGIYIQSTNDVFLKNVIIANNTATAGANGKGGGLYVQTTTSFILEYSTVIRNRIIDDPLVSTGASYLGGGIYASSPANQISNCFIENNKIQSNRSSSEGGGLYVANNLNFNITNTSIINNSVISTAGTAKYLKGGGIACYGNATSVSNLNSNNISNNTITISRGEVQGGGSYFSSDTLRISDCYLNSNRINSSYTGTAYNTYGCGMYATVAKSTDIANSEFNLNSIYARSASGGGLSLISSSADTASVHECQFSNNVIQSIGFYDGNVSGGGLLLGLKVRLNNCQINNNNVNISATATSAYASGTSNAYGGGVSASNFAEFINCSINSNTLNSDLTYNAENYMTFPNMTARAFGGGIYSTSKLYLNSSDINGNSAISSITSYYSWASYFKGYTYGGGIYNEFTTSGQKSLITDCNINNNIAESYSSYAYSETKGGGIYSQNMDILKSIVDNNDTYTSLSVSGGINQGGGIYHEGTGNIFHTTISNNDASAGTGYISGGYTSYTYGGGLYSKSADPVSNCLIHNNSVTGRNKAYGGGIYNESTSVFSNLTVAKNTSYSSYTTPDNKGSGIYTNSSSAKFRNSIIYFNDLLNYYDLTTTSEVKNSVIQLYPNGATNFNIDPLFSDTAARDFHVSASSIAINRGDNTYIPAGITTDLDGNLRISGTSVDIGAYELDLCKSYTTIHDEVCFGTPYIFNGQNLTTSGIYKDTLTNVALCDSIITLNFTVKNPAHSTDVISACETYTWIDGLTYTTDNNTATFTYPGGASNGCDSIVTLNLTINHATTGTDVITACESYTWIDGITYTASNNTATHTLTNVHNCDSVVTLNLTINHATTGTDVVTACNSYTWIDGITYTASNNTATFNIAGGAANGCDSLVTLNLTINHSATGSDVITACNSYTWINGVTYTASNNTATFNIAGGAANGCDSLVTLNLTINHSATGTDVITACNSYTWINGVTYTASNNTATFNIAGGAANGCDSLVTLNLTINHPVTGTDVITACNSYTWIDGATYTASNNTATFNIAGGAANGCDSLVTLNLTINHSTTGTDVITACNSYTWINGVTYTTSNNTATFNIAGGAANGCDSLVTLNLTINHSTTGTDVITACDSYTWIDGITYTASNNTATFNIAGGAANGCDSLVTLNLTINHSATGTDVITACDSYIWIDGITYTASNNTATFNIAGGAANGCDSLVTLNLTINHSTTGTDVITACGSYTWIDGITYTASNNTATFNIVGGAANGCDSLVTLNLTINHATTGTDVITACDSYIWIDGITYTASNNTATFNIAGGAANGCDSLVTLNLTVNHSTTGTGVITACESYTWIDGITYTASNNTATFNIAGGADNGCDSLVTLNLTINHSTTGTDVITACNSYTWINGVTYTTSNNTATFNIAGGAANGCDSLVTLDLTINHSTTGTDVITACDSYIWIDGITYTASNNTATFNIAGGTANGCDSLVTLNLTINHATTGTDVITACDSYTWIDGITYTASNNTATFNIAGGAANGCDSLVTLDLTINHSTTGTDVITACNSYTWIDGITYTASNNTATFNIAGGAANGCDSLVTLNLTINHATTGTDVITACDSYTWIDGITYTASNNTATFNIAGGAANGCDSLVTLNLTINHSTTGTDVITACDSYTWIDGITYTASNNTATFNIADGAANGCDSLVTLNLTINHSTTGTDVITACDSYTWINGITYTASNNTATFNIAGGAANGCDSLVTLNLTITILDLSVSINESTITSNTNGATYQWIDCSTNLPVENETNQSFTATVNGDYAVIVTLGTCSDTSACENIIVEKIEPVSDIQFNIYPNPNNGQFKLDLNSDATIEISDALGRIIYSKQHQSGTSVINLENEESAVYYLRVISDGKISVRKVVVHK